MILYHKTAFGNTERPGGRSVFRARSARERLTGWLAASGTPGAVLTGPGPVSWATGGASPLVDRSAAVDLVWTVITPAQAGLVTTEVEADRIVEEHQPARLGFAEVVAVPWHEPEAFVRAAQDLAGAPAARLASDGHPAFGVNATEEFTALRLALSTPEQDDLRDLGADAAAALESALAAWSPGERDADIAARVAAALEARGADAPVLIVGGDERVRSYRHPLAAGAPVRHLAMAVVVARRGGLHAAATRFACAGPLPREARALRERVLRIESAVLAASRPGATFGHALAALDAAYAAEGAPGGWSGHYQGGPIGYAQREFEIAPCQTGSHWHRTAIPAGCALAWNPSLPGGAKAEDTYLAHAAAPDGGADRIPGQQPGADAGGPRRSGRAAGAYAAGTGRGAGAGPGSRHHIAAGAGSPGRAGREAGAGPRPGAAPVHTRLLRGGLERITAGGSDWPWDDGDETVPPRPAVLQLS